MRLLIATRNKHKVEEIKSILDAHLEYLTLAEFPGAPTVVEDAPDFPGNATKKAVTLAQWLAESGYSERIEYVLADDSGLEVDALNGAPGVHSARFAALDTGAEGNSDDSANNSKLLRLLSGKTDRRGRFRCVIAWTPVPKTLPSVSSPACDASEAELSTQIFSGACEGRILESARGRAGFGYDPLFVPDGFDATFAELGEDTKNRISHRSRALEKLRTHLKA
jgi:XTP/dITP diphosphohydrolase